MKSVRLALVRVLLVAVASIAAIPVLAWENQNLTIRGRVIYIDPADKSDAIPALSAPADAIDVQSKVAPDIDFEYALGDHWALELLLTIPQEHDVDLVVAGTTTPLGAVTHLPPTLTAKYYFATGTVRPYVGGGLNVTFFTSNDLVANLDVDSTSIGPALQAGVDFKLNDRWSLSFDAKKVWISTDVKVGGVKLTTVQVDPWIIGAGVGFRFGE